MKLSKILKRVEQIKEKAAEFPVDHELCTQLEWDLWRDVLHDDATGKGSPAKSSAALETADLKFERRMSR